MSGALIAYQKPAGAVLAALMLAASASAQVGGSSFSATTPAGQVAAENCTVKYIRRVNVPAEVEGKVLDLPVEEGTTVNEGDVMAVIDDTAASLALELKLAEEKEAMLNAANEVNLKDARNSEELAKAEAESFRELYQKGATPYYEMKKKVLEAVRATLRIDLAEMQKKIAEAQYVAKRSERQIAEFEKKRRNILAPFAGYIEFRSAQLGEWVQPGSPIATLVQLDRVRVEGDVSALDFGGLIHAGTPVRVRVSVSSDSEEAVEVMGKIGFVSSEIDLRKRYRVWVDIDNQKNSQGGWLIKPGMQAEIIFE